MYGTLRLILVAEGILFLAASALHAGFIASGYTHGRAAIAESVIALVLLASIVLVSIYRKRRRAIALGSQTLAAIGTLVGLSLVFAGIGPQSMLDLVILGLMMLVLVGGILWTSRRLDQRSAASVFPEDRAD